jgi:hypothetical protein
MAEQFRLDQILGQGGAIHHDERAGPPRAEVMETLGDELFARAALADHQHRPIGCCGTARPLDRIEHGIALADKGFGALHALTVGGKYHQLARYFDAKNGGFWRF